MDCEGTRVNVWDLCSIFWGLTFLSFSACGWIGIWKLSRGVHRHGRKLWQHVQSYRFRFLSSVLIAFWKTTHIQYCRVVAFRLITPKYLKNWRKRQVLPSAWYGHIRWVSPYKVNVRQMTDLSTTKLFPGTNMARIVRVFVSGFLAKRAVKVSLLINCYPWNKKKERWKFEAKVC